MRTLYIYHTKLQNNNSLTKKAISYIRITKPKPYLIDKTNQQIDKKFSTIHTF